MNVEFWWTVVLLFISFILWFLSYKVLVRSWLSPSFFFLLLSLNIFIVRPALLIFGLDVPYPEYLFLDLHGDIARAQCYVLVWFSSLILFGCFFRNKKQLFIERIFPVPYHGLNVTRLRFIVFLLVGFSLLVGATYLAKYGSFSAILIAAKIDKELAGSVFIKQVPGLAMFCSVVLMIEAKRQNKFFDCIVGFFATIVSVLVYYMWGAREAVAIIFLGLVFLYSVKSDFSLSKFKVGLGIALLLVLSTYIYISRLESLGASEEQINKRDLITTICISFHMTRFDAFMLLVRDWDFIDNLHYGYDILVGNLSAVPRVIWESKPEQVLPGAWFRQIYEPDSINGWPFSVIGEWVISFWVFGVVLGGFVATYLYRALDNLYCNRLEPMNFFLFIFISLTIIQNGSVLQFLPEYILWLVPLYLINKLCSLRGVS